MTRDELLARIGWDAAGSGGNRILWEVQDELMNAIVMQKAIRISVSAYEPEPFTTGLGTKRLVAINFDVADDGRLSVEEIQIAPGSPVPISNPDDPAAVIDAMLAYKDFPRPAPEISWLKKPFRP